MSDQIEREQQIEEESLTKNSLQIQKAAWIREELEKRRAQEDQLLQQGLCTGNGFLFAGVVCVCRVSAWHRFPDMPCTYVFYRSTGSHSGT